MIIATILPLLASFTLALANQTCPEGFTGPQCDQDINECARKPNVCQNGATCMNKVGGYQCICVNGWTGPDCSENVDDCSTAACMSGATCHDRTGGFYCECPPGKTGILCQFDDGCFFNPCHPNATCDTLPVDGRAVCTCPAGFSGSDCSIDNDECAVGSPCEHGGICVNTPGSFRCECPRGFNGSRCEININECDTNPCQNDGTCLDEKGSYKCICAPGFTGIKCEIEVDECANNPCQNGAECKDYVNSFRCLCQKGFWGERCEFPVNKSITQNSFNHDSSSSAPMIAIHHPQANDLTPCPVGWEGFNCSEDIDECATKNRCKNSGICVNYPGSYRCDCPDSFTGPNCERMKTACEMKGCVSKRHNGKCDQECNSLTCLFDGGDCLLGTGNPWAKCSDPFSCWNSFKNGKCDQECNTAECLYDGNDCVQTINDKHISPATPQTSIKAICDEKSDSYCLKNYANGICDQECNSAECGWDGADCDMQENDIMPASTEAQGLLVIRVEPAIEIGNKSESGWNIELARLLRKIAVMTQTTLRIQNFRQLEVGTEIELIADNRKCRDSCYNTTELMALFINALKVRTKDFDKSMTPGQLSLIDVRSQTQPDIFAQNQRSVSTLYVIGCSSLVAVCALVMVISIGSKQKVKEKAIVWFPEGFKPVLSSRNRDPTNRKPGRGVSTLQALGGNFFRGIKRNERNISTNPNGMHSTDIDKSSTTTPNGGGIYHEPYDQYDQYGTYGTDSGSIVHSVDEPMTPTPMPVNPINLKGPHGYTPLMVASMSAPSSKEPLGLVNYGTTGEMTGAWDNNVTDLLNRGAQVNLTTENLGETALHLAARHGRVDSVRTILERCDSQDVNAQDNTGRTPLHSAIAANSEGVFELLIRCRATDLNAQTNDGTTPLILATRMNAFSMLEELIQKECEVTKSDADGKTALHWAAATGNVDIIKRLLEVRETNKDAQDLAEETPLFLAAREGSRAAVELLLSYNANKDISDQMDRSPIDIARSRHHLDIVRLLESSTNHVVMPATPKSLTSSLSPLSSSMSPPTSSPTKSTPPISMSQIHRRHNTAPNLAPPPPSLAPPPNRAPPTSRAPPPAYDCQTFWTNNNGLEVYNVPFLKNYMTPSPDSPFSLESSMASPPGVYTDQQYQNPNLTGQKQAGVFI